MARVTRTETVMQGEDGGMDVVTLYGVELDDSDDPESPDVLEALANVARANAATNGVLTDEVVRGAGRLRRREVGREARVS